MAPPPRVAPDQSPKAADAGPNRNAGPSEGMPEADALVLVESAAARLWTPEGAEALAYLRGRGLGPETIRAASAGRPSRPARTAAPTRARHRHPVVRGDRLALVKVRQPEGRRPKYAEVYRNPERPPTLYLSPETIRPGRPVVITEGEFDALMLGQALGELAAVVTLGSASGRPARTSWPPWPPPRGTSPPTRTRPGTRPPPRGTPTLGRVASGPRSVKDWTEAGTDAPGTAGTALNLPRWWGDDPGRSRPHRRSRGMIWPRGAGDRPAMTRARNRLPRPRAFSWHPER